MQVWTFISTVETDTLRSVIPHAVKIDSWFEIIFNTRTLIYIFSYYLEVKNAARSSYPKSSYQFKNTTTIALVGAKSTEGAPEPVPLVNNRKGSLFLPNNPSLLQLNLLNSVEQGKSTYCRLQRALSLPVKYRYHSQKPGLNQDLRR